MNGSEATQTAISRGTSQDTFCRGATMTLSAGSTVSLQLFGLLGAATLTTPGGAELQIEKLSP
ncbi:MAG: hypothetical protein LC126_25890 [Bryobacterales bacterium]|nr:hypothetical protein [Bryobacterales bacterium]